MSAEPPLALLETMRWERGVALLDRHLARLQASAAHFGYPCDERGVRAAIRRASAGLNADRPHRLRLTLDAAGRVAVGATPLDALGEIRRAVVHPAPVEPGGPLWRHKTTRRAHYDGPLAHARARGADEAVLVDASGHVVEGTRTTVWIEDEGRLLTPPLDAGGLPGVYRAHVLATRADAAEAVLRVDDLLAAEAVWLSNAVRGLFPVHLQPAAPPEPGGV